jgi:hypothetical protein
MTISNITVSPEIGKELMDAGFPQNTIYFCDTTTNMVLNREMHIEETNKTETYRVALPTSEEILELLPKEIVYENRFKGYEHPVQASFILGISGDEYFVSYRVNSLYGSFVHAENANKLVDALGKLLIWCIKNGYVTFTK